MSKKPVLLVLVLVSSCVIAFGLYAQGQRSASPNHAWEYKVFAEDPTKMPEQTAQLNQLGADGWEVVSVTFWNQWMYFYLKRAK